MGAQRKGGDNLFLFTYYAEALSSLNYLPVICIMQKRVWNEVCAERKLGVCWAGIFSNL